MMCSKHPFDILCVCSLEQLHFGVIQNQFVDFSMLVTAFFRRPPGLEFSKALTNGYFAQLKIAQVQITRNPFLSTIQNS